MDDAPAAVDLRRELETAERLARRAGEAVLRHRAGGIERRTKAGNELVTGADLEADAILRHGLAQTFPGDAILSEEAADAAQRLRSLRTWILDPIDGTEDFAAGGSQHAVSVGLSIDGRPALGVVYNPARDELFAGCVGGGVRRAGTPVRVSTCTDLSHARITVSGTEWAAGVYRRATRLPLRPLSSSAYKLARVAAGVDDATVWIWPRKEWDVCAGVALVIAAGGVVTLLDGAELRFNRPDVRLGGGLVAAGPALHPLLRAAILRLDLATR